MSAIDIGFCDGQDNPPANIWAFKIQEVQKYMSITNYSTGPDPLIVNKAWYDKLPGDLKKVFDKVAAEAVAYSVKLYRDGEADIIKELGKSMAINYVKGADLAKFVARAQSVHDIFIAKGDFSQADIDAAKKAARSCS